ncbi:MAG: hypothetical protein JXR25_11785 [Pontiellaceae bacterium]|nr:hypothetical protein [Pontiellaceae bacterium]MBN2785496.1 hypothetical protein [Pontiellaceae bacterium]
MSEETRKKRFFLAHKKSSAFVVSMAIHAVFALVALTFVAVKVYIKPEQTFETKEVNRPKMNLRKLQVPVKDRKKTQAPKLRQNIVSPKINNISITMPEIVGVPGGMGAGSGAGLGGLGFNFDMGLFGGNRGSGNELIGTFYDLKQTKDGELTEIGQMVKDKQRPSGEMCKLIRGFVGSGFNEARLKDYFKAPKLKYATAFMMPQMDANAAPKAFSVEDQVQPSYWICHYKGKIAAPETGRYRFTGLGDDILMVRVGRRLVLDACWPEWIEKMSSWVGEDNNNRLFPMDNANFNDINFRDIHTQIDDAGGWDGTRQFYSVVQDVRVNGQPITGDTWNIAARMVIGDWFDLRKGQVVDIDILIGEIPGGRFMCRLMIEQEGKQYKPVACDAGVRRVLPAFMTTPVDDAKLIQEMRIDPNQVTLDGPLFGVRYNAK